jgi:hypothetical protein
MTLLDALLTVMTLLAPCDRGDEGCHYALAMADEAVLRSRPRIDLDRASVLLSVQFNESGFRTDAVGDCLGLKPGDRTCDAEHATSFGVMQLHYDDARAYGVMMQVVWGNTLVTQSQRVCDVLPINERLAYYARGSCESEAGRRISRHRYAFAAKIRAQLAAFYMGGAQ